MLFEFGHCVDKEDGEERRGEREQESHVSTS